MQLFDRGGLEVPAWMEDEEREASGRRARVAYVAQYQKRMNREGKPRPVPNRKRAAKGGRRSSRKGIPNKRA